MEANDVAHPILDSGEDAVVLGNYYLLCRWHIDGQSPPELVASKVTEIVHEHRRLLRKQIG